MTQAITAIYEGGVLRPTTSLSLAEGARVSITIQESSNGQDLENAVSPASDADGLRGEKALAFIQSLADSKGADDLPADYDFLEALNANRGPGQRPLFSPDQKGVTW